MVRKAGHGKANRRSLHSASDEMTGSQTKGVVGFAHRFRPPCGSVGPARGLGG